MGNHISQSAWPPCFTSQSDASPELTLVKDVDDDKTAIEFALMQGVLENLKSIHDMASKVWIALNETRGPSAVWGQVEHEFVMAVFDVVHETAWEGRISPTFYYKNDQGKPARCAFVVIRNLSAKDEERFDATCAGDARASSDFLLSLFFQENPGFLLLAMKDARAARYIKSHDLHQRFIRSGLERIIQADMEEIRPREKRTREEPAEYRRVRLGEVRKKKSPRMSAQGFRFQAPKHMIDLTLEEVDFTAPTFSAFTGQQLEPIFSGL